MTKTAKKKKLRLFPMEKEYLNVAILSLLFFCTAFLAILIIALSK